MLDGWLRSVTASVLIGLLAMGCGARPVVRPAEASVVAPAKAPGPVQLSETELRDWLRVLVRTWRPAAPVARLRGVTVQRVRFDDQPGSLELGYADWCSRRGTPGDCVRLLEDQGRLSEEGKLHLALWMSLGPALRTATEVLSEISEEQVTTIIVGFIAAYLLMWLAPTGITQGIAVAVTAAMVAKLGAEAFLDLRDGFAELRAPAMQATRFAELRSAANRFGDRVGPHLARVFVLVVTAAIAGALPRLGAGGAVTGFAPLEGAAVGVGGVSLPVAAIESVAIGASTVTFAVGVTAAGTLPTKDGEPADELSRSQAQVQFRRALGPDPYGGKGQAHHILDYADRNSALARRLKSWGIDLNGKDNGVWLPCERMAGDCAAIHRGRTGEAYRRLVQKRLRLATDRETTIQYLNELRQDLLEGRVRINSAE